MNSLCCCSIPRGMSKSKKKYQKMDDITVYNHSYPPRDVLEEREKILERNCFGEGFVPLMPPCMCAGIPCPNKECMSSPPPPCSICPCLCQCQNPPWCVQENKEKPRETSYGRFREEEMPWKQKRKYIPPTVKMDDLTVHKLSYLPPGEFIECTDEEPECIRVAPGFCVPMPPCEGSNMYCNQCYYCDALSDEDRTVHHLR